MFERHLLTDEGMERIGEAVLTVLEKVGAKYQSDEILKALEAKGAKVDHSRQVATFPHRMTHDFLDGIRKEHVQGKGDDKGHHKFTAPGQPKLFHQLAQYFYDCEKRERRIGNREDYIHLLKFGDALHRADGVGHCLLLSDVPALVEPLEVTLMQFEHVHRPRGAYVQDVRQIEYLMEMEDISGVKDLTWLANCGFSSPLRLGKDIADRFVRKIKRDDTANLYIMTISGAGTPVTVAGTIVLAAAEFMANWMAGRAISPTARLSAGSWIATMDMHSGEASYHTPDAIVRNFGIREFMRRWTGIATGAGGGSYCPAKVPGIHATLEKAYRAMAVSAFAGSHPGIGIGLLDGGLAISPVQFLLDCEMSKALEHLNSPIEVNEETIGLDAILDVGHAEKTNYMEAEHTVKHFRSATWLPELLDRNGWIGPESEERVLKRAQERVNDLVASYEKPDVDEDMLNKLRAVVERARKELT
ncbi:MAG: trimethylamine methyltransferase family protein [Planctomycetota bacterium]